jgi:hypothetical protein
LASNATSLLTQGIIAQAVIAQNQPITKTGTVAAEGGTCIGFSKTSAAIGERFSIAVLGSGIGVAGGTIAANAALQVGANGTVITQSTGAIIGRAMNEAVPGDHVEVFIAPTGLTTTQIPRFVFGLIPNDTSASVLASNAAILAEACAIPGTWYIPLGDFAHNPFTITASVKLIGMGAGDGYGPENTPDIAMNAFGVTANTSLRTVHTSGGFGITVIAVGCSFDSIKFVNDNVQDSASGLLVAGPDAVSANRADGLRVNNCGFRGGYTQLLCGNTVGYTVAFNTFLNPQGYCLKVENFFVSDEGDPAIMGNSFNSFYYQALAALYFVKGGGVKFVGNKINRQPGVKNDGSTWFINGVLFALTGATGVLTVTGNSIENILREAIVVDITNAAGYFGNFVITGNEFENTALENTTAGIRITGRAGAPVKGFHIADNLLSYSNGIDLTHIKSATIGVNTFKDYRNGTPVVRLSGESSGVKVFPQNYNPADWSSGTPIMAYQNLGLTNATSILGSRTASFTIERTAKGITKTVRDLFLIDMETYHMLKVRVQIFASMSNVGCSAIDVTRFFTKESSTVVVACGPDTGLNLVSAVPTYVAPSASAESPAVQDLQILFTKSGTAVKISAIIPAASASASVSNGQIILTVEGGVKALTEYA